MFASLENATLEVQQFVSLRGYAGVSIPIAWLLLVICWLQLNICNLSQIDFLKGEAGQQLSGLFMSDGIQH